MSQLRAATCRSYMHACLSCIRWSSNWTQNLFEKQYWLLLLSPDVPGGRQSVQEEPKASNLKDGKSKWWKIWWVLRPCAVCQSEVPGRTVLIRTLSRNSLWILHIMHTMWSLSAMQVELQQYYFLVMIDYFLVMIDGVDFMNVNTSLYLHSWLFSWFACLIVDVACCDCCSAPALFHALNNYYSSAAGRLQKTQRQAISEM